MVAQLAASEEGLSSVSKYFAKVKLHIDEFIYKEDDLANVEFHLCDKLLVFSC
jgi:hypothetical protein